MTRTTNVLPELQWHNKNRNGGSYVNEDVTVTITKASKNSKEGRKRLGLSFRNNLFKVFDSRYITFAILKNRIYFKAADRNMGYAITQKNTNGYVQATLVGDDIKEFEQFIGDYSLKFDEFYELYYIERA